MLSEPNVVSSRVPPKLFMPLVTLIMILCAAFHIYIPFYHCSVEIFMHDDEGFISSFAFYKLTLISASCSLSTRGDPSIKIQISGRRKTEAAFNRCLSEHRAQQIGP